MVLKDNQTPEANASSGKSQPGQANSPLTDLFSEAHSGDLNSVDQFPDGPIIVAPPAGDKGGHTAVWAFFTGALVVSATLLGLTWWFNRPSPANPPAQYAAVQLSPTITATPTPWQSPSPTATAYFLPTPPVAGGNKAVLKVPTPSAGGGVIALTPSPQGVGWASNLDGRSHFNDPNIHVGYFRQQVYHGAIQFDLSGVPANAKITYAALVLAGLGDQNLGSDGLWQVQLLSPEIDAVWPVLSFDRLNQARVETALSPALTVADLSSNGVNIFTFGPEQQAALQTHIANGMASFRLDGPVSGGDNLFTWDSGYNSAQKLVEDVAEWRMNGLPLTAAELLGLSGPDEWFSDEELLALGRQPVLWIVTDSPEYVVVTATPTPENALTAVALAPVEVTGTATPLPAAWVTPIVVTATPLPANEATATYQAQVVTAEAGAFGTATPTPLNVWTATPTPALIEYVSITSTPTPENVVTRAAVAATATYQTQLIGTPTPFPTNWATPRVVTPMPVAANAATAQFQQAMATAEASLFGVIWTATPTSIYATITPVPTFTPTPVPQAVPAELVGRIIFLSDQAGSKEATGLKPMVYAMNPDGSDIRVLSGRAAYDSALARDGFSADLRFRSFVGEALFAGGQTRPAIFADDLSQKTTRQLTYFQKSVAYDPAWSPAGNRIAFVTTESGNDDIWVINEDGSGLTQLTDDPNYDKSPSWSPDGTKILFWSNRTGKAQLWLMNSDGSNQHIISPNQANDWNPVWVKFTTPPPAVAGPTPTPFSPYDYYN